MDDTSFSKRRGWQYLEAKAASKDRDDRHLALVRAYAWLEHALRAVGYTRRQGSTAELIKEAYRSRMFTLPSYIGYSNPLDLITRSIKIRHAATHVDTVPNSNECKTAVRVFGDIWRALRKGFVTETFARTVSGVFVKVPHIIAVALYGSMARSAPHPGDVDLLLFDDGFYSEAVLKETGFDAENDTEDFANDEELDQEQLDASYDEPGARTKVIVQKLPLANNALKEQLFNAGCCRWLDILVLDAQRFGVDAAYTLDLQQRQSDALFFDNVAIDLRLFEPSRSDFTGPEVPFFAAVRKWRRYLEATFSSAGRSGKRSYSPFDIALTEFVGSAFAGSMNEQKRT